MFRTVLIKKSSKLQLLHGYLVIFDGDEEKRVFLDDISLLLIEATSTLITVPLLLQLIKKNIAFIICDEKHNPSGTMLGFNNHYSFSGNIQKQLLWNEEVSSELWVKIVTEKIRSQCAILKMLNKGKTELLETYLNDIRPNDETNREGLAAKVYFNALFGQGFNRQEENIINGLLNYGYAILLSCFNREIVSSGYLTQIGIFHKSKTNPFNLTSDFMEPFRPVVDLVAYLNIKNTNPIRSVRKLLTMKLIINSEERYLDDAIRVYVRALIGYLEERNTKFPKIEYLSWEKYSDVEIDEINIDV